jgi:hypothetical protein
MLDIFDLPNMPVLMIVFKVTQNATPAHKSSQQGIINIKLSHEHKIAINVKLVGM